MKYTAKWQEHSCKSYALHDEQTGTEEQSWYEIGAMKCLSVSLDLMKLPSRQNWLNYFGINIKFNVELTLYKSGICKKK